MLRRKRVKRKSSVSSPNPGRRTSSSTPGTTTCTTAAETQRPSSSSQPANLPSRYNFSPPAPQKKIAKKTDRQTHASTPAHFSHRDVSQYPPPMELFQTSSPLLPRSSDSETPRMSPRQQPVSTQSPRLSIPSSPLPNSDGHSNYFSNDDDDECEEDSEDEEEIDDTAQYEVELEDSRLQALDALLSVPNRDRIRSIITLSPLIPPPENTIW